MPSPSRGRTGIGSFSYSVYGLLGLRFVIVNFVYDCVSCFSSVFRFLCGLPFGHVGLRRFPEVLADFRVGFLGQVGERDADGPFRSAEAATGHEHDAAMLGQPEEHIDALVILPEESGEIRPVGLLGPHHQIELDVIEGPRVVLRQASGPARRTAHATGGDR